MKRLIILILPLVALQMQAQDIYLKDGRKIEGKGLRRNGDSVMSIVQMGTGTGEVGYPLSTIAKIEFPEPPEIKSATELLLQGKPTEALAQIDSVVKTQGPFKDVPGNWWSQAALIQLSAYAANHADVAAEALINDMLNSKGDPEVLLSARVRRAASLVRKGLGKQAIDICEAVIKQSKRDATLADAWQTEGYAHLQLNESDPALLSFLHVSVFYPDQKLILPGALLGSVRAYQSLEDYTRAKAAAEELTKTFPGSAEAAQAQSELKKIENKSSSKTTSNP